MSIFDLFLIALGLSMDAFAVSVCKGLSVQSMRPRHALVCGVWFGVFQALMPLCGYLLGAGFAGLIGSFSHWVAFILLAFIGVNMLRESFGGEEETPDPDFSPRAMLPLAVATSIDALAAGVSFAAMQVQILPAVARSASSPAASRRRASRPAMCSACATKPWRSAPAARCWS